MKRLLFLFFVVAPFFVRAQQIESEYLAKADQALLSAQVAVEDLNKAIVSLNEIMITSERWMIFQRARTVEKILAKISDMQEDARSLAEMKKNEELEKSKTSENYSLTFLIEYSKAGELDEFSKKSFKYAEVKVKRAEKRIEALAKNKKGQEKKNKVQSPGKRPRLFLKKFTKKETPALRLGVEFVVHYRHNRIYFKYQK